jgi:hypothetical protein
VLTAVTTFEILIPLTLYPVLLSSPICVPENVGVNKIPELKQIRIYIYPSAGRI